MSVPDGLVAIPAPTENDRSFKISDVLTIYEAAMVYAGRHPYPHFFYIKDGSIEEHREFLKLGVPQLPPKKRARAWRSWDIYCEILKRIEERRIQPVKAAYDSQGRIDLRRTFIRTSDLAAIAKDRCERPKYLRHLLIDISVEKSATMRTGLARAEEIPVETSSVKRHFGGETKAKYKNRLHDFEKAENRYPTRDEDYKWGRDNHIPRDKVRELRRECRPPESKKGGRPTRNLGKNN